MKEIVKFSEMNEKSDFFIQEKIEKLNSARDKKEQWHMLYEWIRQDVIHFNDFMRLLEEITQVQ